MATCLSQQLQQALLNFQMRKKQQQEPDISSSSATAEAPPPPPPKPSLQDPTSSNLSSFQPFSDRDEFLASSVASLPLQHDISDTLHQVSFHDYPTLQFINNMLMEEDIGDHTRMLLEGTSFQATGKVFYDILDTESSNRRPAMHADELAHEAFVDPASQGSDSAHEKHAFRSEGYHSAGVSTQDYETAINEPVDDEYEWLNALLNDGVCSPYNESDATESVATSSVGGSLLSPPQNSHSNDVEHLSGSPVMMNPMCFRTSMQSASLPTMGPGISPMGSSRRMHFSTLHETHFRVCEDNTFDQPLRRPDSDTPPMHAARGGQKVKRAALQLDLADAAELRPRSSPLSVKGSVQAMVARSKEEVVSYVHNDDLNAEMCAKVLNDGLGVMVDEALNSHPLCIPENADRERWNAGETLDLNGLLVGLLVSCARAVAESDIQKANELLQVIRQHTSLFGNGEQRMAHYFSEGLVARLSNTGSQLYTAFTNTVPSIGKMLKANHLFVEVCPFVKVSHYFANKAIFEAAKGASRLHIVDYGILYGLQWPCLISALAERKGGPPCLRITGIDFPRSGIKFAERVEITGRRLSEYAKMYGVPFEYHAVASKWETILPSSLHLQDDEVLVVNSMYRLRHLLDETVLASNPRKTVFSRIQAMNPKIFVQGVRNANFNSPFFMSRFKDALTYFSHKFDILDATINRDSQERMTIEREMMGRDIINVVACEGLERIERSESYKQWENRTRRAGFEQMPLDENMLKEVKVIVQATYSKHFSVDEDGCWMLLRWKGHTLYGLSVWRPNGDK